MNCQIRIKRRKSTDHADKAHPHHNDFTERLIAR